MTSPSSSDALRRSLLTSASVAIMGAAFLPTANAQTPAAMVDTAVDFCRMQLVFKDEFNDLSVGVHDIESFRWISHTPWRGDFGDALFTDPRPSGLPFSVRNGLLSITAWKDEAGKWRSGLIASADGEGKGFAQQYGYFESRIKLPSGTGTWPAFWLGTIAPKGYGGPTLEVDVLEYYGHAPQSFQSAYHIWTTNPPGNKGDLHVNPVPRGSLEKAFHVYGVKVTPEFITYYLDRQPVWQIKTPDIHQNRLVILLNLALGSGFPIDKTPNPSVMQVDYVRAYAFAPARTDCPSKTSLAR